MSYLLNQFWAIFIHETLKCSMIDLNQRACILINFGLLSLIFFILTTVLQRIFCLLYDFRPEDCGRRSLFPKPLSFINASLFQHILSDCLELLT